MNNAPIMSITAVLSLAGLVVAGLQVTKFHREVRQTQSIDRKAMLKAARWVIVGGFWTGFFVALTAILVIISSQQVRMTALGAVALLLGIPTACVVILVVSFLIGVFQLYALVQPSAIPEEEVKSNHST